jgi:hypothetical protein
MVPSPACVSLAWTQSAFYCRFDVLRESGRAKRNCEVFNATKGYGFIAPDNGGKAGVQPK